MPSALSRAILLPLFKNFLLICCCCDHVANLLFTAFFVSAILLSSHSHCTQSVAFLHSWCLVFAISCGHYYSSRFDLFIITVFFSFILLSPAQSVLKGRHTLGDMLWGHVVGTSSSDSFPRAGLRTVPATCVQYSAH